MTTSANVMDAPASESTSAWMDAIRTPTAIVDAIHMITHPVQYVLSCLIRREALCHPRMVNRHSDMGRWPTTFSGVSAVINRLTPAHRDRQGAHQGYDILVSLGDAVDAKLYLQDLGAILSYEPGTAICLAGRHLSHAVKEWGPQDRVCLAYYVRDRLMVHAADEQDMMLPKLHEAKMLIEALHL